MLFNDYKFRCSGLGHIMTEPRRKKEFMSETAKTYLKDIFIEEQYGRKWDFISKYTEKGNYAEEDSLTLVTNNRKKLYIKNKETLENDFIKGTPDIITEDSVIDIKTCWDLRTFISKDSVEKNYWWQLQGYMYLTGKTQAELIYTLVNTPEHIVVGEKMKRMYQKGYEEGSFEWAKEEEEIDKWFNFDDIPEEQRMRVYAIEADEEAFDKIRTKVELARLILDQLTLN